MATSASARHHLFRTLESVLGDEDAATLMDHLPEGGWDEVATKSDLRGLGSELRSEMTELRSELKTDIAELRSELKTDIAEVRSELKTDIAELRTSMGGLVTKADLAEQLRLHVDARVGEISRWWMFSCIGMQAATIAGVIAAVRL